MSKYKFTRDYELKASPKYLYPYISTATGLSQWFADNVTSEFDNKFNFVWDKKSHPAKLSIHKLNKYAKFEFINNGEDTNRDTSYIEFTIDTNELTQSVFLKVADYSEADSEEDLQELWDELVANLKEVVSGNRKAGA